MVRCPQPDKHTCPSPSGAHMCCCLPPACFFYDVLIDIADAPFCSWGYTCFVVTTAKHPFCCCLPPRLAGWLASFFERL
jgi:hypothetical protein